MDVPPRGRYDVLLLVPRRRVSAQRASSSGRIGVGVRALSKIVVRPAPNLRPAPNIGVQQFMDVPTEVDIDDVLLVVPRRRISVRGASRDSGGALGTGGLSEIVVRPVPVLRPSSRAPGRAAVWARSRSLRP